MYLMPGLTQIFSASSALKTHPHINVIQTIVMKGQVFIEYGPANAGVIFTLEKRILNLEDTSLLLLASLATTSLWLSTGT